jgi:DNA-binding response OmpR family regulator
MNGFQVLNCLRSMWKTRNIPVILLTARHDQSAILKGAELGAVDYVTKPFDVDDLVARLQRLIAAR